MSNRMLIGIVAFATLAACSTSNNRPPAKEPVSTTGVTSSAFPTAPPLDSVELRDPWDSTVTTTAPLERLDAVAGGSSSGSAAEPTAAPASDAVTRKIQRALAKEPTLANVRLDHVEISHDNGHVTLRGHAPTVADAVRVEVVARETNGVVAVTNDIEVVR